MKQASAKQKKWMKDIAEWAGDNLISLYGQEWGGVQFQLHHVVGRSAKHNKVSIGHDFIIPVPIQLHDVSSNHPLNVTHHKKKFINEFGRQSNIFKFMVISMANEGYKVPNLEVCNAVMDTYL